MCHKTKTLNYKICLEASQPENKIILLEKYEVDVDNLRQNHKEFIKRQKKLEILKPQQRFRSKKQFI